MLQTPRFQDSCPFLDGHTDVLISRGSYWLKISGEFWYEFFIVGIDKPDLLHKVYYRIYLKRPKALSSNFHYKLRTKCNKLPYVVHTRDVYPEQSTEQLHMVLSMFKAAIASTTSHQTVKYKETPAAGCLTFMEVTERNGGSFLGYEDGKSTIFINESNYKKKFQEYLDNQSDPRRWERIAREGRRHALENLSNDVGVKNLIHIMRNALGEENSKIWRGRDI